MKQIIHIDVGQDYHDFPAGRDESDSPNGEKFRLEYLEPKLKENVYIEINFNNIYACTPSFLEEAFGGLIRAGFTKRAINKFISFVEPTEVKYKEYIWAAKKYIDEASKKARTSKAVELFDELMYELDNERDLRKCESIKKQLNSELKRIWPISEKL